jgi:hypothetical protein
MATRPTYLIGSLIEERRQSERALHKHYRDALVATGAQGVLDLDGISLGCLMTIVAIADGGLLARLAEDEQVRAILLLHGLHPEDLETRVRRAVERLRPHLGVHGLRLDVVEITKGTARLKVHPGNGATPKASLLWTLPSEIEDAIVEAAPDIDKVIIDGLEAPAAVAITSPSE